MPSYVHKFTVSTDYNQFYLMDAVVQPLIPEEITQQDILRRCRAAPHIVVVHSESAGPVAVEVEVEVGSQPVAQTECDHVADISLDIPSGNIMLCGCVESLSTCKRISVKAGAYLGHVLYWGAASEGGERYRVVLWQGAHAAEQQVPHDVPASGPAALRQGRG